MFKRNDHLSFFGWDNKHVEILDHLHFFTPSDSPMILSFCLVSPDDRKLTVCRHLIR